MSWWEPGKIDLLMPDRGQGRNPLGYCIGRVNDTDQLIALAEHAGSTRLRGIQSNPALQPTQILTGHECRSGLVGYRARVLRCGTRRGQKRCSLYAAEICVAEGIAQLCRPDAIKPPRKVG